jgi:arylsulfatase
MKWPGQIPAGTISNQLASTIDFLPTFAEMLGIGLPENKIDGVSILSLMKGEPGAKPRETFYYYYQATALEAVRKNEWKLVLPHSHRTYEGQMPGQGGVNGPTGIAETGLSLYDLRRDPGERYDVKDSYPEVVEELQQLADVARQDLGDKLMNIEGKHVREPGRIENYQ